MTIDDLNAMSRETFVQALGCVFEHSPWVAERAWARRPFESVPALHDAMTGVVNAASFEEQDALLRAHPDLGARASSDESMREQAGAGLDALTPAEHERLRALNAAYRDKFGFPFLLAVKGAAKDDVLAALERRLLSPRDAERQEAMRQVFRIARFRLEDLIT